MSVTGPRVSIDLPVSKTDPSGRGATRTRTCACGVLPGGTPCMDPALCPTCALLSQVELVPAKIRADPETPLFPSASGGVVSKPAMVATIKHAAATLRLPLTTTSGAERRGGHALRRGGAQFFGAAGVEIWRIQALAHHSSGAILGYLQDSHPATLSSVALEAALQRDLSQLRAEVDAMRARTRAAPAPAAPPPQLGPPAGTWVRALRRNAPIYMVDPVTPGLTRC
eukprot:2899566-Alexandrium_andersonii.AAC.1